MVRTKAVVLLLILLASVSSAEAAGKVSVDPNSPGVRRPKAAAITAEGDLNQKVTYQATHKTIFSILEDLSSLTKVNFKAGRSSADWKVRDRKMDIYVKDLPLPELMNSMARVMHLKWVKDDLEGAAVYRLYMDEDTILKLAEEDRKNDERKKKWIEDTKKSVIGQFLKADSMSDEEIEKLKDTNPHLYLDIKHGCAKPLAKLLRTVPEFSQMLYGDDQLTLQGSKLSSEVQQLMTEVWEGTYRLQNMIDPGFDAKPAPDMTQTSIRVRPQFDGDGGSDYGATVLNIQMHCGKAGMATVISDPQNAYSKEAGKLAMGIMSGTASIESMGDISIDSIMYKNNSMFNFGELPPDHADEPALHTKVKLEIKQKPEQRYSELLLPEVEQALAECGQLSIVSDSFVFVSGNASEGFRKCELELQTLLDKISQSYRCNWWKHSSVVEIREWDWYKKWRRMIPEATIEKWRQEAKKTGRLDIGTLAQMASLTREQLCDVRMDEALIEFFDLYVAEDNKDVLLMYGSLTGRQQRSLFTNNGLDIAVLKPEQRQLVEKWIKSKNAKFLENPDAQIRLFATKKIEGKQFLYTFRAITSDGLPDIEEYPIYTPMHRNAVFGLDE